MRDLLPEEAKRQKVLSQAVLSAFGSFAYEIVSVPPFEYATVLEHDMGEADSAQVLRFVEPETGEVVALRPDMTPQIARLVASRLSDAPAPVRLCYEGAVVRRRRERARRDRHLQQAGIELVGLAGIEGDLEVISVASSAMRAAGLTSFTLDLGHACIAAALLRGAPEEEVSAIVEALAMKDVDEVRRRAEEAGILGRNLAALVELPSLCGGTEVWARAEAALAGTPAETPARELRILAESILREDLVPNLIVDLGETWSFSYYTGAMFRVLSHGPGEPVGSGGRYDQLFDRFGVPRPAAGFAIDLHNLAWAIEHSGTPSGQPVRLLVVAKERPRAFGVMDAVRLLGVACAVAPEGDFREYAAAWRYTHVLELADRSNVLSDLATGVATALPADEAAVIAAAVRAAIPKTAH